MNFDIAIIGGGPAGYTAAERAGANGLKAVLFEKKAIGGVCLNEGCIPTKVMNTLFVIIFITNLPAKNHTLATKYTITLVYNIFVLNILRA